MIFKDRRDAGRKLLVKLFQKLKKTKQKIVVLSLLRGGTEVGDIIAKGLSAKHLPLVVAKISSPDNPELAIGALCFDTVYLEKKVIDMLAIDKSDIRSQIQKAKEKFNSYLKRFGIKQNVLSRWMKNKIAIIVDDGVATGSTIKVAILFVKSKNPKSIILAIPVAPEDFSIPGIDKEFILHKANDFKAVSQFYKRFPQVEDDDVKRMMKEKNS